MAATTRARDLVNRVLRPLNLRLETLTVDRREQRRLDRLEQGGHFSRPAYPLPPAFASLNPDRILRALPRYADRFATFESVSTNDVGYTFANPYFSSPDAEVLYTLVREEQPRLIVEVGSGNSTAIMRQAVLDGALSTTLVAIDPQPRREIQRFVDEWHSRPFEDVDPSAILDRLGAGDVLFIDSSHRVEAGNDVARLYLEALPRLAPGVLVHIHDIFLPYEYPRHWLRSPWFWNEQYLLQALLSCTTDFEVEWASHYLQRTLPGFPAHFPRLRAQGGASLWLRKRA